MFLVVDTLYAGGVVTNVVRTCGPTHLLIFDFMSNKNIVKIYSESAMGYSKFTFYCKV